MRTSIREAGRATILDVSGQVVIGADVMLQKEVESLLGSGHKRIVVNLRSIDRIDSAGLGTLVHCKHLIDNQEGAICLIRPEKDMTYKPIWMMKLNEYFQIYEDELSAVGSL